MKAIVKLFGGIKAEKNFPKNDEGDILFEFSDTLTVLQLINNLSLNKKPFLVVLNGIILNELLTEIKDGDEISFFPPIAGGEKFALYFSSF